MWNWKKRMVTPWCTAHGNHFLFKILFISDIQSQRQECVESYNSVVPSGRHKIGLGRKKPSNSFRLPVGSIHEKYHLKSAKPNAPNSWIFPPYNTTGGYSCLGFEHVWPPVPLASSHTTTCAWWQNYCFYFQPWPFTKTCFYTSMPLDHHHSLDIPLTYLSTLHLQVLWRLYHVDVFLYEA